MGAVYIQKQNKKLHNINNTSIETTPTKATSNHNNIIIMAPIESNNCPSSLHRLCLEKTLTFPRIVHIDSSSTTSATQNNNSDSMLQQQQQQTFTSPTTDSSCSKTTGGWGCSDDEFSRRQMESYKQFRQFKTRKF